MPKTPMRLQRETTVTIADGAQEIVEVPRPENATALFGGAEQTKTKIADFDPQANDQMAGMCSISLESGLQGGSVHVTSFYSQKNADPFPEHKGLFDPNDSYSESTSNAVNLRTASPSDTYDNPGSDYTVPRNDLLEPLADTATDASRATNLAALLATLAEWHRVASNEKLYLVINNQSGSQISGKLIASYRFGVNPQDDLTTNP